MKATKFIAVGALALTSAAFAEGITSDIVGYKANDLRDGQSFISPCFKDVAGEGADLTKFVPGGSYESGVIIVSKLDHVGRSTESYSYSKNRKDVWEWTGDEGAVAEGDVVFEQGEGVAVEGANGLSLTTAGAVSTDDVVIELRNGQTFAGNCTATSLDLTAIIPGGEYESGDIIISILDRVGRSTESYSWSQNRKGVWEWTGDEGAVTEGDVVFAPGQGFAVEGVAGANITIPGPSIK